MEGHFVYVRERCVYSQSRPEEKKWVNCPFNALPLTTCSIMTGQECWLNDVTIMMEADTNSDVNKRAHCCTRRGKRHYVSHDKE